MQRNFKWEPCTFLEKKLPLSQNWFAHKLAITSGQLSPELFKVWLKKARRMNSSPTQWSLSPHGEDKVRSSHEGPRSWRGRQQEHQLWSNLSKWFNSKNPKEHIERGFPRSYSEGCNQEVRSATQSPRCRTKVWVLSPTMFFPDNAWKKRQHHRFYNQDANLKPKSYSMAMPPLSKSVFRLWHLWNFVEIAAQAWVTI